MMMHGLANFKLLPSQKELHSMELVIMTESL